MFFRKNDLVSRAISNHKKGRSVSPFVREMLANETAETINARFKIVKERAGTHRES